MYRSSHDRKPHILLAFLILAGALARAGDVRTVTSLNAGWMTVLVEGDTDPAWEKPQVDETSWYSVSIPHNWDSYAGYSQAKHGNLHGTAWYRKPFHLPTIPKDHCVFLFFEGVGSYAKVFINGQLAGEHAGGLTTFTLNITDFVKAGSDNLIAVQARHPASIRDLPWVCGGCALAYGFSEGPQPFGIFRPVSLIITDSLRIEPFGIHVWNDQTTSRDQATLNIETEIRNYGSRTRNFRLVTRIQDPCGNSVSEIEEVVSLRPGKEAVIRQASPVLKNPVLWSPGNPALYRIISEIQSDDHVMDRVETPYGIRRVDWPALDGPPEPLRINGIPFFINGVADYEHLLGGNHAFTDEQIQARVSQIQAAGFNAFRDAHHPHNLRFNEQWDRSGMLWWTQFGAHIWFEREDFQANYKRLLRDWVKERRNSPSLVLYGLQNESKLPPDFARECAEIIRSMDPTASTQRLITTCNGGTGTDWDIPQNWSGTYGGDLNAYGEELSRQRLVGEYGAWRSIDLHTEGGFIAEGPLSEDRMTALMETKVLLADKVKDKVIGHFAWPFTTHQNPGRNVGSQGQQTVDGIRVLDRIGPANNKGLFSSWGEPLDVFYMYRSNFAPPDTQPMVYLVSHTWPDRWPEPGIKDGIIAYSNCEEVELFNGYKAHSLGRRTRQGRGTHFQWDGVEISGNILYAEGRINGKVVVTDLIQLHHLPDAVGIEAIDPHPSNPSDPNPKLHDIYRVNAGGPDYTDHHGNLWHADRAYTGENRWGSLSWAEQYPNLRPFFGSKRKIHDPVMDTHEDALFQSFRYGRSELSYTFEVPPGEYVVDLFFIEPWYGTGGGIDCTGWRLFDVDINGQTVVRNLDIWKEAGRATAFKKTVTAESKDGKLVISFPQVRSGQAIISAIRVGAAEAMIVDRSCSENLITNLETDPSLDNSDFRILTGLDTGISRFSGHSDNFTFIPWELRESDWIQMPERARLLEGEFLMRFTLSEDADVFITHVEDPSPRPTWLDDWTLTALRVKTQSSQYPGLEVFARRFKKGERVTTGIPSRDSDAPLYSLFVRRRYPPPPSRGIDGFTTISSRHPDGWQDLGNFRSGRELYRNGGPVIARFSSRLSDSDWIRAPAEDASNPNASCQFTVHDHTEVYVALDPRITHPPEWMQDWIPSPYTITTAEPVSWQLKLFKKRFAPDETVRLGPNGSSQESGNLLMYTVILQTVRKDVTYEAEDLSAYRNLRVPATPPQPVYLDLQDLQSSIFEWTIKVGVGDRYGLNFRYTSRLPENVTAKLTIIDAGGGIVCQDDVQFAPTNDHSWQYSRNRTCDSINAGTYRIRLESEALKYLKFDHLVVE